MPLNVRGAAGRAGRAGLGAVAVVIGRSVVPAFPAGSDRAGFRRSYSRISAPAAMPRTRCPSPEYNARGRPPGSFVLGRRASTKGGRPDAGISRARGPGDLLRYHRSMLEGSVTERMANARSGGGRPLRVAVLGAGNVGREVVRSLLSGWEGPTFDLVGVAVRDLPKAESAGIPKDLLTDAPAHLVANEIDLI